MRRITIKHAKPGMIVELPIYDNYGALISPRNKELTVEFIRYIGKKGVTELFIQDWRVADVLVAPLFTPQTEGRVTAAIRQLILNHTGKPDIADNDLTQLEVALAAMVGGMELNIVGEINVSGSISLENYLYLQPVKTAGLSLAIGRGLNLSNKELVALGLAAVLKDIGLSPDVINAVDSLAEGGSAKMHDHPIITQKILSQHQITAGKVAEAVLQHHEQWSGRGYPQGLKGEAISLNARIIAIADAFVDLLSVRPNRPKYMSHEAIEYVMAGGGDQFDSKLVELFVRQIPSYPAGLSVQMNTGDVGIVSNPKLGFIARPIVRICFKANQGALKHPFDIDLSKAAYQNVLITKVLEYD
jgi:HD-GYP domain-containing protein (c-di-GMP phosphodiesterase class II)